MATTDTPHDVRRAVADLLPRVRESADRGETERSMPRELFEELKAAGVFRMLVPRSHGGLQAGLLTANEVLEELSRADGATGWTTMIGAESPQLLSLLPRETYDRLYRDGADVTVGGSFATGGGRAEPVEGGYRVSGRWPFASGCQRWELLFVNCVVLDGGEPRMGPRGPQGRAMLMRAEQLKIEDDTWKVLGLRATGSHHISVEGAFVPAEDTFDIFFGVPCVPGVARFPIIDFSFHIASCVLGIAQGALDDFLASARSRQRMSMRTTLAQAPLVQYRVGRADAQLRAVRAFLRAEAEHLLHAYESGEEQDFLRLMTRVYANNAWVVQTCTEVVDTCFTINGSSGIYDGAPLQRRLRDIHTISQHASLNDNSIIRAGAALLGEQVDFML